MRAPVNLVALLHGPDQRGLVARASGWIFARQGNILHADQHRDEDGGVFFQRIEWQPAPATKLADELMSHAYAHLFGIRQTGLRSGIGNTPRWVESIESMSHPSRSTQGTGRGRQTERLSLTGFGVEPSQRAPLV